MRNLSMQLIWRDQNSILLQGFRPYGDTVSYRVAEPFQPDLVSEDSDMDPGILVGSGSGYFSRIWILFPRIQIWFPKCRSRIRVFWSNPYPVSELTGPDPSFSKYWIRIWLPKRIQVFWMETDPVSKYLELDLGILVGSGSGFRMVGNWYKGTMYPFLKNLFNE